MRRKNKKKFWAISLKIENKIVDLRVDIRQKFVGFPLIEGRVNMMYRWPNMEEIKI